MIIQLDWYFVFEVVKVYLEYRLHRFNRQMLDKLTVDIQQVVE